MKTHARRPAARTTQSAGPESGPDLRRVLDARAAWRGLPVGAVTHLPGNSMRRLGGAAAALQATSGKEILADAAYSAYGTDTKHLSLTYNVVENTATLEIRSQRGVAVRVEGKVKGSVTKSSRDFKASYSLATNTWTLA